MSFVSALKGGADRQSGGAPQMVGLYRVENGQTFGIRYERKMYLHGSRVHPSAAGTVDWRNERFERIDGRTGKRLPGAQRH